MRLATIIAGVILASSAVGAAASEKPLPEGISIISEADAKSCRFVDIVSASDSFVFKKADKASRTALIRALEKAMLKGANSAVMSGVSSANKETTVMLTAHSCPEK